MPDQTPSSPSPDPQPQTPKPEPKPEPTKLAKSPSPTTEDLDTTHDVTGKTLELTLKSKPETTPDPENLYIYKNIYNLLPNPKGNIGNRLKTVKFFANEINILPPEVALNELAPHLQCLQLKVTSPGFSGLQLDKLKGLKELELSKPPPRANSAFPILAQIAALKCLTRLVVCHFSIRYLPPEIGCLVNLEHLDLSFNKLRNLPEEMSSLNSLISLKVANNKLVVLPAGLSSLNKLENLDISRNRLTSLGSLVLSAMPNMRTLNLQYNKLLSCEIPAWIYCNMDGNGKDICFDELTDPTVEMDVLEDEDGSITYSGSSNSSLYYVPGCTLSSRCFMRRRSAKRWKRRQYLQQRARQERLNHSRKWKLEGHKDLLTIKSGGKCKTCRKALSSSSSVSGCASELTCIENQFKQPSGSDEEGNTLDVAKGEHMNIKQGFDSKNCSCVDSTVDCDGQEIEPEDSDASSPSKYNVADKEEQSSSVRVSKVSSNCKRQSDRCLDNPKPRKSRRSADGHQDVSHKYSKSSFCGTEDHLPDGFYDAGRDRPFMFLGDYEQTLDPCSREVILVDRRRDEELDAISMSAQAMVFRLKKLTGSKLRRDVAADDNFLVASWLALFVSDHFGGSDRSYLVERVRKEVSGSNYHKPFVCTCATGNSESRTVPSVEQTGNGEDVVLRDMCERSLEAIKARRNSVVVPMGFLQYGVCRHRAILVKYLCDRMEPPVPCELVRGYLDFFPHAWNVIPVRRGGSLVRMIVDACRPHDIREETDPEYFCRYVPLTRVNSTVVAANGPGSVSQFPSISKGEELEKAASSSLVLCKVGSLEAAAKVRTLEVPAACVDEIRKFEYTCVGEVRILGTLRGHPCIVEIYGHKISSDWTLFPDGKPGLRVLRSAILMEYVRGGSIKNYVDKLWKAGEKHVPVLMALYIARDVACALKELHSKHIIHRDVKSENVLIDLDEKRPDGSPIVKLSDFDRAVPLRSSLHTCCISHAGIPPPDVCVGTPRWMAPEVLHAMHSRQLYGLEVDIWSYGCFLSELLTLRMPYMGLAESKIHDLLQNGRRPPLTDELERLGSVEEPSSPKSAKKVKGADSDLEGLQFLVDLFRRCTNGNSAERPTAADIYDLLVAKTSSLI